MVYQQADIASKLCLSPRRGSEDGGVDGPKTAQNAMDLWRQVLQLGQTNGVSSSCRLDGAQLSR
jgi:hypothetical protein